MDKRLLLNIDPIISNQEDISLNEMINRTFYIYKEDTPLVIQSKEIMTLIFYNILQTEIRI